MNLGIRKQHVRVPHYGEIYTQSNSTVTTFSGVGGANKVQVTIFSANGQSSGLITPDHTNDHITVGIAGDYLVNVSMAMEGSGGVAQLISYEVFVNNGTTAKLNLRGRRILAGGGGDVGSMTLSGIANFAINDTVEVWVWNSTNTNSVLIYDITLSLVKIDN